MAAITYKCPNCGGGLSFDPETQKYACDYCRSEFTEEELEILGRAQAQNQDENAEKNGQHQGDEASPEEEDSPALYICPSCGAQIVTDHTTAATFCYYCHNPVILSGRLSGDYKPDRVIPFQIDRKKAEEIFKQWVGKKKFVPGEFTSQGSVEKLTGVYYPYWLYSCHVQGRLEGQGTAVSSHTSGNMQVTTTRIYDVNRSGETVIQGVVRNALRKADRRLADGVQPFETEKAQDFSMACLSGFMAEKRDMEAEEFSQEVGQEVDEFFLNSLKNQGETFTSFQVTRQEVRRDRENWLYALLPVWILTYRDRSNGKIHYFALNGQTGKTCGSLTVD